MQWTTVAYAIEQSKLMDIAVIKQAIASGQYRFTLHAIEQMADRDISRSELEQVILSGGEIIEEYPTHRYGPCCLVYGRTRGGRKLHIVVSLKPVWIITAYEPDPGEWIDHRTRRTKA